jgi:hypothetical protein
MNVKGNGMAQWLQMQSTGTDLKAKTKMKRARKPRPYRWQEEKGRRPMLPRFSVCGSLSNKMPIDPLCIYFDTWKCYGTWIISLMDSMGLLFPTRVTSRCCLARSAWRQVTNCHGRRTMQSSLCHDFTGQQRWLCSGIALSGRLLCNRYVSSKEHLRETTYSLMNVVLTAAQDAKGKGWASQWRLCQTWHYTLRFGSRKSNISIAWKRVWDSGYCHWANVGCRQTLRYQFWRSLYT